MDDNCILVLVLLEWMDGWEMGFFEEVLQKYDEENKIKKISFKKKKPTYKISIKYKVAH